MLVKKRWHMTTSHTLSPISWRQAETFLLHYFYFVLCVKSRKVWRYFKLKKDLQYNNQKLKNKLKIEQHEPHSKIEGALRCSGRLSIPAPLVTPVITSAPRVESIVLWSFSLTYNPYSFKIYPCKPNMYDYWKINYNDITKKKWNS